MDPDAYAGAEGLRALARDALDLATGSKGDRAELHQLLREKASRTFEKHEVPRIAAAALLRAGPEGVSELMSLLREAPGHIYPASIVETLWLASRGGETPRSVLGLSYSLPAVTAVTQVAARQAIDDLIVEAQSDPELFSVIVAMMQGDDVTNAKPAGSELSLPPFTDHAMRVWRDASISLTDRVLNEFESLVAQDCAESVYQTFLEAHPVLVDPLAAEVINRQRLGDELVTDFVVRRHDQRYVTIEIEKPSDRVLTSGNDFTKEFTHAVGQVLDFRGWVNENIAYAQKRLPGIEAPSGLVIIGRRSDLIKTQENKLRRWCENSRHIEILTYDDVLVRGRALLRSLRRIV